MTFRDDDNDLIPDAIENPNGDLVVDAGETNPFDRDSDDDGIEDGVEDANQDGVVDAGETAANNPDSDGDGEAAGAIFSGAGDDEEAVTSSDWIKEAVISFSPPPQGEITLTLAKK